MCVSNNVVVKSRFTLGKHSVEANPTSVCVNFNRGEWVKISQDHRWPSVLNASLHAGDHAKSLRLLRGRSVKGAMMEVKVRM